MTEQRVMRELGRAEALRRLASVPIGRVVFTRRALPAIRPVGHVLLEGAAIADGAGDGTVVAYEADEISAAERTGWSVVVTGVARAVTNPVEAARCREALRPWLDGGLGQVISIEPEIVTGFELCLGADLVAG
jgi:hypothetical protein